MADEEGESKPIGSAIKGDFKMVLLFGVLIIIGVIVLAFLNQRAQLGLQGVNTISSFLGLVDAVPNGLASLVTGFFHWLGTFFSNTPLTMGV